MAERLRAPRGARRIPSAEVAAILEAVRTGGDEALRSLTAELDGVVPPSLRVSADELSAALAAIDEPLRRALRIAYDRILAYHAHSAAGQPAPFVSGGVTVTHL